MHAHEVEPTEEPIVLCVDDNATTRKIVHDGLTHRGYHVLIADGGERAFAILETIRPHIILLDVMMPDMDGYDFCARLRRTEDLCFIPVLFFSARNDQSAKARALALGALDYVEKPIRVRALAGKIREHLETSAAWKKLPGHAASGSAIRFATRFLDFKANLVAHTPLSAEKTATLARLSPTELAQVAALLEVSEEELCESIATFLQLPLVEQIRPEDVDLTILPASFSRANLVAATTRGDGETTFVVSNPFDWHLLDCLRKYRPKSFRLAVCPPTRLRALFGEQDTARPPSQLAPVMSSPCAAPGGDIQAIEEELRERFAEYVEAKDEELPTSEAEPLVALVNWMIETASERGASDIHIEPQQRHVSIRIRVDGRLEPLRQIEPQQMIRPIAARIKVMSGLDITERRLPQDGRIHFDRFSRQLRGLDLRVSTAPMTFGEKIVMRLLDQNASGLALDTLGFSPANLELYRRRLASPYGMVLHVGPTGSGKSRTLYSGLSELNRPEINIQTIEDPVEYMLAGVSQLQVNPEIGLTFAKALRSYLRQDPDIILVGEIRDVETARIAVEAALTGHLLFSTLHTNDAAATVTRLVDMGVDPVMVSSSIVLICAQRLARRLCTRCKQPREATPLEARALLQAQSSPPVIFVPTACEHCRGTGFRGRIGIHELFAPNDAARERIASGTMSADSLRKFAIDECGMTTLFQDATAKVLDGTCAFEDALAFASADEFRP